MPDESDYILHAKAVSKYFDGVQALSGVDLEVRYGEVHAVVGENGAGKTTLMNILGGIIKPDSGTILFNGKKIDLDSPLDAFREGISTIHQELTMMPHLSVMENIFMGSFRKFNISFKGFINRNKLLNAAREALQTIELSVDPETQVKDLSVSEQQEIEIIKAITSDSRLIIMDEPNSSLTDLETKHLFEIIGKLKDRGVSIIYVSHKIEEVLRIADTITVLRDGMKTGTIKRSEATTGLLFSMIAGRERTKTSSARNSKAGEVLLRAKGLCGKRFSNISFDLKRGEVLGFYGLVGSGRSELARALFGADPPAGGNIFLDDSHVIINSPRKALNLGIAMVPEDRKELGLFMNLPVFVNMTISNLRDLSNLNFIIKLKKERKLLNDYLRLLNIRIGRSSQPIKTLSGGNQQKVVLARNLMTDPKVLILDEPTHGIDIGAREEVHRLIAELTGKGVGVIFISSEMPEIMSVSDRVAVLHEGQLAGIYDREDVTEEKLIASATGYNLQIKKV